MNDCAYCDIADARFPLYFSDCLSCNARMVAHAPKGLRRDKGLAMTAKMSAKELTEFKILVRRWIDKFSKEKTLAAKVGV